MSGFASVFSSPAGRGCDRDNEKDVEVRSQSRQIRELNYCVEQGTNLQERTGSEADRGALYRTNRKEQIKTNSG